MNSILKVVTQSVLVSVLAAGHATAKTGAVIAITQAEWKENTLSVSGKLRNSTATTVDLYDSSGRPLGQATVNGDHLFNLTRSGLDRPELVCSVVAKTRNSTASTLVKGRDKTCAKVPACRIVAPIRSVQVAVNTDITFKAKVGLKDKSAKPLRMEWDFAVGSMGATPFRTVFAGRPAPAKIRFVRDNTRYRVRFTAWDKKNRYCEDSTERFGSNRGAICASNTAHGICPVSRTNG